MFNKVLVANRGEIAVRICRTLDALGVGSVAVYAEADRDSLHVEAAQEAVALGEGGVAETYLDQAKLLAAVASTGADAVHPGYGFLSENAVFAEALEAAGVAFIGPRPEHIRRFGLKHEARALARAADVSLLPGSDVLGDVDAAQEWAARIGFPVMLKSSAGGGGIGMARCANAAELADRFLAVERLAKAQFGDPRLFVETCVAAARHVEVQAFGDGKGGVAILGDRDCSLQRRHQKVVEECPAPNLPDAVRQRMQADARALLRQVGYRSAGTVEFLYDAQREAAYFLEVNTRLQVEHGVTELVFGVDLVRWMVELAAGELPPLRRLSAGLAPSGSAMEARLCAEDPQHGFRPSPGTTSVVSFPSGPSGEGVRVDTWLRSGTEIPPLYDSLVAKVIGYGEDRESARKRLDQALAETVAFGVETNRDYLRQALASEAFSTARHDTETLAALDYQPHTLEMLAAGTHTTVQAWPGRQGYWPVGVPPSGPMDDFSFRLGNRLLGNAEGATGLEITMQGPTLRFHAAATVCVAGFCEPTVGERDAPCWQPFNVAAGEALAIGKVTQGVRAYLLVAGGLDVPKVMGSAATFTLGRIGGLNGRALAAGDVLHFSKPGTSPLRLGKTPDWSDRHEIRVTLGPHCTDEFLTRDDLRAFLAAEWTVHYHSNRTGVRLIGPRPQWSRSDGGDAGLHPSNIHDNAYAFGAIDFTGDMPVVLGPDGPSLGGFVCPAVVIAADRWKLGQLAAGEKLRLRAVAEAEAHQLRRDRQTSLVGKASPPRPASSDRVEPAIVLEHDDVRVRRAGDEALLFEFGPNTLDIELRLRVHAFQTAIESERPDGVLEMTAGVRSLLIRYDPARFSGTRFAERLLPLLEASAGTPNTPVASRIVRLPLSWDDPACHEAIDRYVESVRADAPWCPDNIEFIRRINGLPDREAVKRTVFDADYLVMGLGDVYLGAPVATPLDPRHRLVTTKYNPARTWTAENSVGIGGAYLCIYGMEGPGGYQFVGRTLQVWNRHRRGAAFDKHWLLRPFDRIRFFEVDANELAAMRDAFPRGALAVDIEDTTFDIGRHRAFLASHQEDIDAFSARRRQAFAAELDDWRSRGLMTFQQDVATVDGNAANSADDEPPFVVSPMAGSVWAVAVQPGQRVDAGDTLFVVESMKAEFEVPAPATGVVREVLVAKGQAVSAGQPLAL